MSDEQKTELKKNGFVIFSNVQFIVTMIIMLLSFILTVGAGLEKFSKMREDVDQTKSDLDRVYILYQQSIGLQKETKFNLKTLMKNFKLEYVEDTDK